MRVRRLVPLLALSLLAACGDHGGTPEADIDHPTGHDDVVLRIEDGGSGMGTADMFFRQPPTLVVAGDGRLYLRKEETTIAGIVWPLVTRNLPDPELQSYLQRAENDDLLRTPPDYSPPAPIADADDTTVEVAAAGGDWMHRANGLGDFPKETEARERLTDFVGYVEGAVRRPDGPRATTYRPTALRIMTDASTPPPGSPHQVGRWPNGADVRLADVGSCAIVRDPAVVRMLTSRESPLYEDDGTTYTLAAAALLPGDSCSG
jgi:hypothetical protein